MTFLALAHPGLPSCPPPAIAFSTRRTLARVSPKRLAPPARSSSRRVRPSQVSFQGRPVIESMVHSSVGNGRVRGAAGGLVGAGAASRGFALGDDYTAGEGVPSTNYCLDVSTAARRPARGGKW